MTKHLVAAAEALLSDIESMRQRNHWFGGFEWYTIEYTIDGDVAMVEWPNLSISAANLRAALVEVDRGD
jgi:hypothetical protein